MKVILFNGPPDCGKDYACNVLVEKDLAWKHSFAKVLKETTHQFFGIHRPWNWYEGSVKDTPLPDFWGMSPRQAYIWMSEEVIKPKFGKQFFGDKLAEAIKGYGKNEAVVISDCGFSEEIEPIINLAGGSNALLIRISSQGCSFQNDSRSYIYRDDISSIDIINGRNAKFAEDVLFRVTGFLRHGGKARK